jgi:acyl-CoA reductase-like NAD-dependent aldehyde dehydrogenase
MFSRLSPFFLSVFVEVVEHACGMATLQMGEFVPNASNGIDTYCIREPVGICAGICPFNFPAMIPLWVCVQYFWCYFYMVISFFLFVFDFI